MDAAAIESHNERREILEARQQLLTLARHLDRFGRQTEQFLCQQLEQLERAIEEFESEKVAWRRQFQRESAQLARQREDLAGQHFGNGTKLETGIAVCSDRKRIVEAAVRRSGTAPLRILLQPGNASSMQAGLLMFELSKLNRDMGGRGIRFEVDEIRAPRKKLLGWKSNETSCGEILELSAYSVLPLAGRGQHVALDVDVTDRLEDWSAYKLQLIQSSFRDVDLVACFDAAKTVKRDGQSHFGINEAKRHVDDVAARKSEHSDYQVGAFRSNSPLDCIQQQLIRLENCREQLAIDCGLRIHIELQNAP